MIPIGGKSRKTGVSSRKLIERLKAQKNQGCSSVGVNKKGGLFKTDEHEEQIPGVTRKE